MFAFIYALVWQSRLTLHRFYQFFVFQSSGFTLLDISKMLSHIPHEKKMCSHIPSKEQIKETHVIFFLFFKRCKTLIFWSGYVQQKNTDNEFHTKVLPVKCLKNFFLKKNTRHMDLT